MATSQYPNINENQFAGLLQVATAAADAQERNASALGKRKRDDEAYIDHQLRTPATESSHQDDTPSGPILQNSAAVLFREPSEKSKKYSRPPLGKVYTDLELPPELFLQLQSAAKNFMLDPNYPERKSVVGQKKQNSNNDVAKLKLWNCVEQFLTTNQEKTGEANADYYFGHNAGAGIPNQPARNFFWPEDRDLVIKMCMPLFRKMVTNERQRLYASETRKQDPAKQEKGKKSQKAEQEGGEEQKTISITDGQPAQRDSGRAASPQQTHANMFLIQGQHVPVQNQVMLHVNIVSKGPDNEKRRVTPRFTILADAAPNMEALLAEAQKYYNISSEHGADDRAPPAVKVWLEEGLVPVKDEGQWMEALFSGGTVDWMDNELRVLIEV